MDSIRKFFREERVLPLYAEPIHSRVIHMDANTSLANPLGWEGKRSYQDYAGCKVLSVHGNHHGTVFIYMTYNKEPLQPSVVVTQGQIVSPNVLLMEPNALREKLHLHSHDIAIDEQNPIRSYQVGRATEWAVPIEPGISALCLSAIPSEMFTVHDNHIVFTNKGEVDSAMKVLQPMEHDLLELHVTSLNGGARVSITLSSSLIDLE